MGIAALDPSYAGSVADEGKETDAPSFGFIFC